MRMTSPNYYGLPRVNSMLSILDHCQYEDYIASNDKLIYELEKSCKEKGVAYFKVVSILVIFWGDWGESEGLHLG
jgi:hypothetical protein